VRFQERFPGRLSLALGGWLDSMLFQDVTYGRIRDLVSEVGQGILDVIVAPPVILPDQAYDQLPDFIRDGGPSGSFFATSAIVPLLRHQEAMPT
jgi:hypothetical protein